MGTPHKTVRTSEDAASPLVSLLDIEKRLALSGCGFEHRVPDTDKLQMVPRILRMVESSSHTGGGFILTTLRCTRSDDGLTVVEGMREYAVVRDMVQRALYRGDDWWARHINQTVHFRLEIVAAAPKQSRGAKDARRGTTELAHAANKRSGLFGLVRTAARIAAS
jgi:hypothetical protein